MLSPIIPHVCDALWNELRPDTGELLDQAWPVVDESALDVDEVEMVIQVNGKLRGKIMVAKSLTKDELKQWQRKCQCTEIYHEGQAIKKMVYCETN